LERETGSGGSRTEGKEVKGRSRLFDSPIVGKGKGGRAGKRGERSPFQKKGEKKKEPAVLLVPSKGRKKGGDVTQKGEKGKKKTPERMGPSHSPREKKKKDRGEGKKRRKEKGEEKKKKEGRFRATAIPFGRKKRGKDS